MRCTHLKLFQLRLLTLPVLLLATHEDVKSFQKCLIAGFFEDSDPKNGRTCFIDRNQGPSTVNFNLIPLEVLKLWRGMMKVCIAMAT